MSSANKNIYLADAKQPFVFRRQRLDIDCMLNKSSSSRNIVNCDDPYIIDMIKLADQRMMQLQKELDETNQYKVIIDNKLTNFKNQVSYYFFFKKQKYLKLISILITEFMIKIAEKSLGIL